MHVRFLGCKMAGNGKSPHFLDRRYIDSNGCLLIVMVVSRGVDPGKFTAFERKVMEVDGSDDFPDFKIW